MRLIALRILAVAALVYNAWIIFQVAKGWGVVILGVTSIVLLPIALLAMPVLMLFVNSTEAAPYALWPAILFLGVLDSLAERWGGSLLLK